MKVARTTGELERVPRAVACGTFDGVHVGHRRVLEAAIETGLRSTAVTFDPHPRTALGNRVELLATVDRRLELIAELGVAEALVVQFDLQVARLSPEQFAAQILQPMGTEVVVAGPGFRFGQGRRGDLDLLRGLGYDARLAPAVEGVSSTQIRQLLSEGAIEAAARLLGRPPELDGIVVSGDARGGTLGYPTANLSVIPELLVPAYGIYAGQVGEHRAAISIGTNPHYGGQERRIESFLLEFEGDLYGRRLLVELWRRLREERVFATEAELVEQIARDVEDARTSPRPV